MPKTEIALIKKILIYFLCWQVLMFALVKLANVVLPYQPSFPYSSELIKSGLPKWLYGRANFDGVHYLTIAKNGYVGTGLIQAFFPIYPFLIKLFSLVVHNDIISGLIISNLSLLGCLYFGYKLANCHFDRSTANHWLLFLLTFPTSFFLGAVYTESLFLLLILASWWYHIQRKNLISGLLIGLSSGVRLVGLMMILAIFLEWVNKNKFKLKNFWGRINKYKLQLLGVAVGLVPFLIYILFLQYEFNDPLYFFHVQSKFGGGRQETIILWPRVAYRYIKILITARPINWKYFSYVQDFVLSVAAVIGLYLARKKIKLSWLVFSILAYLLPTLTGSFSSMPRYVLVIFPLWMWLAHKLSQPSRWRLCYYFVSVILLMINTILFTQGYWVS